MRRLVAAALVLSFALPATSAWARSGGSLTLPGNVGKGWVRIPTGGNQPDTLPPTAFVRGRGTPVTREPFLLQPPR